MMIANIIVSALTATVVLFGFSLSALSSKESRKEERVLPIYCKLTDAYPGGKLERTRDENGKIKGNWIDLRASEDVVLETGKFTMIPLGICMKLPSGYEAYVLPRSSTYKTWGIQMANSEGVVDESYGGNNDMWRFPAIPSRDVTIHKGDRIAQFRIIKTMDNELGYVLGDPGTITYVDHLDGQNRGGFGSSGKN